jgi:hypothetical protein
MPAGSTASSIFVTLWNRKRVKEYIHPVVYPRSVRRRLTFQQQGGFQVTYIDHHDNLCCSVQFFQVSLSKSQTINLT